VKAFSERALIILLKKHNIHAFNELYDRYWKELYICAYKRLQSKEDVQDILQDIFISIWANSSNIDAELSLRPYLFRSLKFKIIDKFHKRSSAPTPISYIQQFDLEDEGKLHDVLLTKELEEVLNDEIDKLPSKMKEVFLLSRKEYLSNDKIAERLSISSQTVKNQISIALKKLRWAMEDYNAQ
jgi:RNA polymerase sigma-70 factor (family 1)